MSNDFYFIKALQYLMDREEFLYRVEIPLEDILNPKFMKRHSNTVFLDAFFKQGGFSINCRNYLNSISGDILDKYVSETTNFNTFEDMISSAIDEFLEGCIFL